ncbi:hypothetical protein B0H14DRAFT_2342429, partial [Mycena olivaceomarginata]
EAPSKPVTVNWRDMRATIHGTSNVNQNTETTDAEVLDPQDPVKDGLDWLNDGLPDLRTSSSSHFDLASEFDIEKYLHILADSIEGDGLTEDRNCDRERRKNTSTVSSKAAADSMTPKADEWESWA